MSNKEENLKNLATNIRLSTLDMISKTHASHIASSYSMIEILVVLYSKILNVSPQTINSPDRDRFVLSKGHGAASVYATLYKMGFFAKDEIDNYYSNGGKLSGHVSHKGVNGIEISTGSLGHGACIACGIALAGKIDNKNYHTYCIVGDGECNEGSIWEMAMFAAHNKLSNYTIIIDCNKMQALGECCGIIDLSNMADRWRTFGWNVIDVDGHNFVELENAFNNKSKDKPNCIIAHTIKGKGVSFMENNNLWHYRDPQGEFYENAKKELEAQLEK